MRKVTLSGTDLSVSRFVFGTASLHHLGRMSAQVAQLEAAEAVGFTHFDTAPLYGFGGAESALGAAFGDDASITVTTKVGLYPPGGDTPSRVRMLARKIGGKVWPTLSRAVADLSVERSKRSLDSSLRRLSRSRVDLLLLHEPAPGLLQTDEWLRWHETESERVKCVGVAGPASTVAPILEADMAAGCVLQVRDGLDSREADIVTDAGRLLQLTYGYFATDTSKRTSREILCGALARNQAGAVVVSTRSRERLNTFSVIAAAEH